MQSIILEIRNRLHVSQEELARMIGTSFATVNRWENGHSVPGKAAQLRLYDICRQKDVDLKNIILEKIEKAASDIKIRSGSLILFHGSKSGLVGPVTPSSRKHCDFGRGFYMGTDPWQPLTLISDFEESRFYLTSIDLTDLKILEVSLDLEWAMLVAFNRGKMDEVKETKLYEQYAGMSKGCDVIAGSIADDRMFYVLDNFFQGNITDKALVMSLSALQLGKQYVAITDKACGHIRVEKGIELSFLERRFLQEMSEANRTKGISLAKDICRDYRREGRFFDEILEDADAERRMKRG